MYTSDYMYCMWWCNDDDDDDSKSNEDNELNEMFDKNQIYLDTELIYASKSTWKTHNEVKALLSESSDVITSLVCLQSQIIPS